MHATICYSIAQHMFSYAVPEPPIPILLVEVNGHNLQLKLDTGSANTVVSERVWRSLNAPTLSTAPQLTAYGGFSIQVLGSAQVIAKFKDDVKHLPLVVVNRDSPSLLGRIWMKSFNTLRIWLQNSLVDSISSEDVATKSLCQEFADYFEPWERFEVIRHTSTSNRILDFATLSHVQSYSR